MRLPDYIIVLFISFTLISLISVNSSASHYAGADLTYKCLGQDSSGKDIYEITLIFYRECSGVRVPQNLGLCYQSGICGIQDTIYLPKLDSIFLPNICPNKKNTCHGGSVTGYQEFLFMDTLTLPMACVDWSFSYGGIFRNSSITTGGANKSFLIVATLDNKNAPCNSSPTFATKPVPYTCANQPFTYSHLATETDGDSLVYQLSSPQGGGLCFGSGLTTYKSPYTNLAPLTSVPPMTLDTKTGDMVMFPTVAGEITIMVIMLKEYRNGRKIGTISRDIQLQIIACSNPTAPQIVGIDSMPKYIDTICANRFSCIDIYGYDLDSFQNFSMLWDSMIPGATFDSISPSYYRLCWTPSDSDTLSNPHQFKLTIRDDGCLPKSNDTLFSIYVEPNATPIGITGFDTVCPKRKGVTYSVPLHAGSTYDWQITGGTQISGGTTPSIIVDWNDTTAGQVYVSELNQYGCTSDTISIPVTMIDIPQMNTSVSLDTICFGDTILLASNGQFNAWWAMWPKVNDTISILKTFSVVPDSSTFYILTGVDSNLCINKDTIPVYVNLLPLVNLSATLDTVCQFESTALTATGALNYWWAIQTKPNDTIATGSSYTPVMDSTTNYIVTGIDTNGCINQDTIRIFAHTLPVILGNANLDTICKNDSIVFTVSGGISYWWSTISAPTDTVGTGSPLTISPDSSEQYIVIGTDSNGCENTDTVLIIVNPLPPDNPIFGSPFICPFDDSIDYWLNNIPGSTFNWLVQRGTIASGQGTDSIKVAWDSSGTAMVQVVETNIFGCQGDTQYFPVNINITWTPPKPNGPDTLCKKDADSVQYDAIYTFSANYYWQIQGGTILQGDSTSTIFVRWDTIGTGLLWYQEENITIDTICFNSSDSLWVTIFPTPGVKSIMGLTQVCQADSNVSYTVPDTAGSTYVWSIVGGVIMSGDSTNNILVGWDSFGTFQLQVLEINIYGCVGDTISAIITVNSKPVAPQIIGNVLICGSDTISQLYHVSGNPGSTYIWQITGGTILNGQGNDSVTVNLNTADSIQISVVEITSDSCKSDTAKLIVTVDAPVIKLDMVTTIVSNDQNVGIFWSILNGKSFNNYYQIYRRGKSPDSSWQWIDSTTLRSYRDTSLPTAFYSFEYKIESRNLCNDTIRSLEHNTILLTGIADESQQRVRLNWNPYINWLNGVSQYDILRSVDEGSMLEYLYTFSDTFKLIYTESDGFIYCFRIIANEAVSGRLSFSNKICFTVENPIEIPNAFSPNTDGSNDLWYIKNINLYPINHLQIYNRWGNIVFESSGYNNQWDGRNGKRPLPSGTYFYLLNVNINGSEEIFKGSVTIFR